MIPLNNANEVIKSFILEEIIQSFEALGAKKILIEDHTDIALNSKANKSGVKADASYGSKNQVLRRKEFGKGIFDPDRALEGKLFIYDFPNIKSIIEARIHGNQLVEEFSENINLNAGLDMRVLDIFQANVGFNYNRKWRFLVEFYDKN